jgi:predicted DNA-binding transcriptional regulator AlpA
MEIEILTIAEVAAMLKLSKRTIAELMTPRTRSGDVREYPLPYLKIGRSVRFRRSDVESWIEKLTR